MTDRPKIYEVLDLERKIQQQRNEGNPELYLELENIEQLVKQARQQQTYNFQYHHFR